MRRVGIAVSGDKITLVDAEADAAGLLTINADITWPLQSGSRPEAYAVMYDQIVNYLREQKIDEVVVKGSAVSLGGTKLAHLYAAELRGVTLAAAASVTKAKELTKAKISRGYGNRKADEYLKDHDFWTKQVTSGDLRVGSREAALVLLASEK